MEEGLYEQLISQLLRSKLTDLNDDEYYKEFAEIDLAESNQILAQYIQDVVRLALSLMAGEKINIVQNKIELVNRLILFIKHELPANSLDERLLDSSHILKAILSKESGLSNFSEHVKQITPYTRINQSELFTGGSAGIEIGSEIRKEIMSSDRIDFLVSFIKWKGIRIFENELSSFIDRGGKLRVITTTYMGASDAKAIHYLSSLANTEVKVSYNTGNERLHAKAYLFYRNTGFHTAYIGSSNFSRSALTDGLEWNLKVTTKEIGHIIDKFQKTFESYWQSTEFELYNPKIHLPKLKSALNESQIKKGLNEFSVYFDIKPYTYQEEILNKLKTERTIHGNFKNLIVAATGTGKTIISAFDYKDFKNTNSSAKILFIAHRKEILEQAIATYRAILKDNNFGELWIASTPTDYSYIFGSIQTVNKRIQQLNLPSDFYDYIVIDEVHHITANTYRPILEKFKSKILIGLTATPERMDGENILNDFSDKISAEIRLPEALNRKLLSPFQYFGITDATDLSNVSWKQGKYDVSELTRIYTESDKRVRDIIKNLEKYCLELNDTRALGFCVSQEHAKFMATKFEIVGLKAECLTSKTPKDERKNIRRRLENKETNYLFVVDVFNEGVDIPSIDTVLFLRPTESLTIFLQQLGRGLRLSEGKDCLTVLDFVANSRPEYDFENKFRALIGKTNNSVKKEIEDNFPHLPLGCSIVLEKVAKQNILDNIIKATSIRRNDLVNRIQNWEHQTNQALTLSNFLSFHNLKMQNIYSKATWHRLLSDAGKLKELSDVNETAVKKVVLKKWLSTNSISYFKFIKSVFDQNCNINFKLLSEEEERMILMMHFDFWGTLENHENIEKSIHAMADNQIYLSELAEVVDIRISQVDFIEKEIELPFSQPLKLHARYTRDQILAAFGFSTFEKKSSSREGVAFNEERNTELLFVNLFKSEENFSPTTMYEDYAITESLFHWQSQNSSRPDKGKGLSYINHERTRKKILLFIREHQKDEFGNTMGFVFIGECNLKEHAGSQPMNIKWSLKEPIPSYLLSQSKKLVS